MENLQRMENYCSLVIRLEKGEFDTVPEEEQSRSRASSLSTATRSHVPSFRQDRSSVDKDDSVDKDAAATEDDFARLGGEESATHQDPKKSDGTGEQSLHDSVSSAPVSSRTSHTQERGSDDASFCSTGDTYALLGENVLKKAEEHDQGNIGRRRKAISRTSTAVALKGSTNRRRLSSIMTPVMLAGVSGSEITASLSSDITSDGVMTGSENSQHASSLSTAAPSSYESSAVRGSSTSTAAPSDPLSTTPSGRTPLVKVSSMKIWDVVEDDSDDESVEDMIFGGGGGKGGGSTTASHHVERESAMKNGEDKARGTLTLNTSRTTTPALWENDDADDDVQDGFLAIDIERAINVHQQQRESEASLFDKQLSISQFVASATSTRSEKTKEREQQRAPSPLQQTSSSAPTRPRRRGTSIAKRLMSYVSSPKTSSVGGRQTQSNSVDDPTSMFGEEDLTDIADVELGLGSGMAGKTAPLHPPSSTTPIVAPLLKTNSSYLRDCLEMRESSIISREQPVRSITALHDFQYISP